jgi:glycine/D-amino acid oxidase-like deaminating enzyme
MALVGSVKMGWTGDVATEGQTMTCDVCVVGGGSGGFGAALAAARTGAKVVLIEKLSRLGGTSTSALVSNWEPGPGEAFAEEIYQRLSAVDGAVAIAARVHSYKPNEPYGLAYGVQGSKLTFADTLKRAGLPENRQASVVMRPDALADAMLALLKEAGVTVLVETSFAQAETGEGRVRAVRTVDAEGRRGRIEAKVFIDATGGAHLCRAVSCETMLGVEARSRFDEPSAPEKPAEFLNAISLCYRIRKLAAARRQPAPGKAVPFPKTAFVCGVGEDELIVNPLPLVEGMMLIREGYDATLAVARERVRAHWHWLQGHPHFRDYELVDLAPLLGIRESYRVVTEHILTERDVRTGVKASPHKDLVAVADHALDIHGGGHGAKELKEPYGIPYRCLVPKGWRNLLVAGRCAGFSHIAASSCRLNRTMMALGHAAGLAAAQAARDGRDVREVDVSKMQEDLGLKRE